MELLTLNEFNRNVNGSLLINSNMDFGLIKRQIKLAQRKGLRLEIQIAGFSVSQLGNILKLIHKDIYI